MLKNREYIVSPGNHIYDRALSWPYLDYIDLPKMKSSILRYNKKN